MLRSYWLLYILEYDWLALGSYLLKHLLRLSLSFEIGDTFPSYCQNPNLTSIQLKSTLTAVGFDMIMTVHTTPPPPHPGTLPQLCICIYNFSFFMFILHFSFFIFHSFSFSFFLSSIFIFCFSFLVFISRLQTEEELLWNLNLI